MNSFVLEPIAFRIGDYAIYWYAVAYMVALISILLRSPQLVVRLNSMATRPGFTPGHAETRLLVLMLAAGVLIGGRLFAAFGLDQPIGLGASASDSHWFGMSSFGAFAGATFCVWMYARSFGQSFVRTLDLIALSAPLGIFLVRVANHINGDFHGQPVSNEALAVVLGPSHPVALYEAVLEGLLPLVVLNCGAFAKRLYKTEGAVVCAFGILFAMTRFGSEFLRATEFSAILSVAIGCLAVFIASCVLLFYGKTAPAAFAHWRQQPAKRVLANSHLDGTAGGIGAAGVIVAVMMPLAGCGQPASHIPNTPTIVVRLALTNPNDDANCACAGARGAYAENVSDAPRRASWRIYTRDTSSGQVLTPIDGNDEVAAHSRRFLGCTIHAPATQCRFQASYSVIQGSAVRAMNATPAAIYGKASTPSIASCKAACTDTSGKQTAACLPLGVRYFKAVAPITKLLRQADSTQTTLKKGDILKEYGMSGSDDKCGRGDITNENGLLVNEGAEAACIFSSEDLPEATLKKLGIRPTDKGWLSFFKSEAVPPLKMHAILQQRTEARMLASAATLNASDVVLFEDPATAPLIAFEGAGSDQLSNLFGGAVIASAHVEAQGLPHPLTILATTSGCISVDEP